MARWSPPPAIGGNEHLGRRLFEAAELYGSVQPCPVQLLKVSHFEDSRDNEISLDRLGATGLDKKVLNYLLARANHAGCSFQPPQKFDGWVYVPAKALSSGKGLVFQVTSSPESGAAPGDLNENLYHCHCTAANHDPMTVALHLREKFVSGGIRQLDPPKSVKSEIRDQTGETFGSFLSNFLKHASNYLSKFGFKALW